MTKHPGQRIRRLREALGLRQNEFAALFPVSNVTVSRWETGAHIPLPHLRRRIRELEMEARAKRKP